MRILLALLLALGLTGVASAQNTLDAEQTGDGNVIAGLDGTSNALQQGQNTADITQSAKLTNGGNPTGGHTALIQQVGGTSADGANSIVLSQAPGFNTGGFKGAHTAILSQDGNGNVIDGRLSGDDDPAIQDSRTNSTANILQDGDRNTASFDNGKNLDVDQLGNDNVADNKGGGDVTQYQQGNDNQAYNDGNDAYQEQVGDNNLARSTNWVSGMVSSQIQTGDFNESELLRSRGGGSVGQTVQTGDYNVVRGFYQQNRDNSLITDQTSAIGITAAQGNEILVTFGSDGNMTNVVQDGLSNSVKLTQQD